MGAWIFYGELAGNKDDYKIDNIRFSTWRFRPFWFNDGIRKENLLGDLNIDKIDFNNWFGMTGNERGDGPHIAWKIPCLAGQNIDRSRFANDDRIRRGQISK